MSNEFESEKVKIASMDVLSPILISSLSNNLHIRLKVTGNSMYPLFRSHIDSVIIKKKGKLHKYDIVLYQRDSGKYILHRIVKIKDDVLYLAGDNETIIEYPVYKNQVVAAVDSFYRKNKHISCSNIIYKMYSFFWVLLIKKRHSVIAKLRKLRYAVGSRR